MKKIIVDSFNIVSPLGVSAAENFAKILDGKSGVEQHDNPAIDDNTCWASIVPDILIQTSENQSFTHYEKLLIASVEEALKHSKINISGDDTLFVFSTTKGNISLLEATPFTSDLIEKVNLTRSAYLVAKRFGNNNKPIVISNACISGIVALLYAQRMLRSGKYKNAVVTGADTISKFVYSGFKSFQALSPGPCHPFSASRDGINLGEAGASIILTMAEDTNSESPYISLAEGGISNDSNHISGPSRTGQELSSVITKAIQSSGLSCGEIDFISAHGTATLFNDEMEAKAFHLSGLSDTPVNSLKGYFGHTLGAAGLLESVISIMSLLNNVAIPSLGYQKPGVTPTINILEHPLYKSMNHCLKTASGFGGCNAAIIFSKN